MRTLSVEELVLEARNDGAIVSAQHAAFTELVRRFEDMAFAVAMRGVDDIEEARDVTQDAFTDAWLKLKQLDDPAAFGGWLKRLVLTQCARRRRRPRAALITDKDVSAGKVLDSEIENKQAISRALEMLPKRDAQILVQFYLFGRAINEIALELDIPAAAVAKRLYSARLKIRRNLPPELRHAFIRTRPTVDFARKVREGAFVAYVGEYHFAKRPDLIVHIKREDDMLIAYCGEQRNVLASSHDDHLVIGEFDGEATFVRAVDGTVTALIYYEFGRRAGVARKVS